MTAFPPTANGRSWTGAAATAAVEVPSVADATPPAAAPAAAGSTAGELEAVRDTALALLAQAPADLVRMRVRLGSAAVELTWPRPPGPTGGVEPAVGAWAESGAWAGSAAPMATVPPTTPTEPEHHQLTAPIVGVFYRAPSPGAPPFVEVGSAIAPGQQVGIVEAMKMLIPVNADVAGTVKRILRADGETVEFGDPLFALAPASAVAATAGQGDG